MSFIKYFLPFFALVFVFSGLIINVLQLITYVTVNPFNRKWFHFINDWLSYCIMSQLVFWYQSSGGQMRIFLEDPKVMKYVRSEHAILIFNHSFEIDWIMVYAMGVYHDEAQSAKCATKNSLKYLPVFGPCWWFCNWMFLHRDWEKDKLRFGQYIDDYIDNTMTPTYTLMFCEGTRCTEEKLKASQAYAKEIGIEPFKHHLYPRKRGFVATIQHVKKTGKKMGIWSFQMGFSDEINQHKPTLSTLLNGDPLVCDVHWRRYDIDDIDCTSDETIGDFLVDLYREKDKLAEFHNMFGHFPGISSVKRPSFRIVLNFFFWSAVFVNFLVNLVNYLIANESYYSLTCLAITIIAIVTGFLYASKQSSFKTSSKFGHLPSAKLDANMNNIQAKDEVTKM